VVVHPGVDLNRFRPTPRPNEKRVLYLGGRRHEKGHDRAIGLADTLAGQHLHEVAPEEVPALIASHDVVLMPSRREPFGVLAVEAIASGRWVVAANVDGLREIVIDGVNGTLVDGDEFAGALKDIPDYDAVKIAPTVHRFSLDAYQHGMAQVWDRVHSGERIGISERA
jgi:glycosyltransferase involved in cell wall biosynthesis